MFRKLIRYFFAKATKLRQCIFWSPILLLYQKASVGGSVPSAHKCAPNNSDCGSSDGEAAFSGFTSLITINMMSYQIILTSIMEIRYVFVSCVVGD